MPDFEITHCSQPGCSGTFAWGRTVRDPRTNTGGRLMPVDYPFPIDSRKSDGTLLPPTPGAPVPNLGYRVDQWGSLIVRVLTRDEPIRADERPAYPHWATCTNPPQKHRTRPTPPPAAPVSEDQGELDLGVTPAPRRSAGPLSDARLFPRRTTRRG